MLDIEWQVDSGTWKWFPVASKSDVSLSDTERKKMLEFIECQRNSRALVLFVTYECSLCNVCALLNIQYWTKLFSLRLKLERFPYLFFQCYHITAHFSCLSALKTSLLPLLFIQTLRWHNQNYLILFSSCDCWRELRKAELVERSYLFTWGHHCLKRISKYSYVLMRCVYSKHSEK